VEEQTLALSKLAYITAISTHLSTNDDIFLLRRGSIIEALPLLSNPR
jgi:hypothetical protein